MSNKIVSQLLAERGPREAQTIRPDATARQAAAMMSDLKVGSLVVVEKTGEVVGIVSERDLVDKVNAVNKLASTVSVSEIMTRDVEAVFLTTNLRECEEKMERLHIRHLPVLDKGALVGVISIRDLLVSTRAEQEELVRVIRDYTGL